jgi:hypothetical protein
MTAAGVGLTFASPTGPVQTEGMLGLIAQHQRLQAPHFRRGERDQAGRVPPFPPLWGAARVTSRKASASRHSVTCRCHPSQRRTSY